MVSVADWMQAAEQLGVLVGVAWLVRVAVGAAVTGQPGAQLARQAGPYGGRRVALVIGDVGQGCGDVPDLAGTAG